MNSLIVEENGKIVSFFYTLKAGINNGLLLRENK